MKNTMRALAAVALAALFATGASAQDKVRLAVGGKSAVFYLPLSVTERLGYFKDAGLDVEISDVASGGRTLQAIVGGSAEIGIGTFDHAIQMQAKNQPVVALLQYGRYPGFVLAMMTGKADLYKSPKDLKGLKIGVTSPGSSTHFMAAYMMVRSRAEGRRRLVHRHRHHLDRGRGGAARRDRRHRQLRSDDDDDGKREAGEDRRRHAHRGRHQGGVWRAVSRRRDLRHAGLHREKSADRAEGGRLPSSSGLKWIASHSAEDIAKLMPEEYALGNLPIYIKALSVSKPMYSPDGHFEPGAVGTAYAVLKRVRSGGGGRDLRSVENLQRHLREEGDFRKIDSFDMSLAKKIDAAPLLPEIFSRWFASRGWTPRAHQLELLARARDGRSVLLIAPTGGGKTLAGFLPTLVELDERGAKPRRMVSTGKELRRSEGLHTLYISPLKALAVDIARNLETPVREMGLPIRIETRTGDTPTSKRQRQRRDPPDILLTTPEQLALLLASADAPYLFGSLKRVVLDELHALVTSKRGDLLSLGLARLWRLAPGPGDDRPVGDGGRARGPLPLPGAAAGGRHEPRRSRHRRRRRRAAMSPCWSPAKICPGPAIRRATRSRRSTS